MLRALLMLLLLAVTTPMASAQAVSPSDSSEFQRIISEQIAAFRADDGQKAYSFAAPSIRRIFPTPDIFMSMVKEGYQPVYRPQSYGFGETGTDGSGRPFQNVTVVGPDGKTYEARYSLERQPDGSWQISGCAILEVPGLDA